MRRVANEGLGVEVEIVVGQPPIAVKIESCEVELRYFFCGIITGDLSAGDYAEIRWVNRGHLREYEFDEASRAVVEWLLQ